MPRLDGTGPNGDGRPNCCRRRVSCDGSRRRNKDCVRRRDLDINSKEELLQEKELLQKEIQDIDEKINNM